MVLHTTEQSASLCMLHKRYCSSMVEQSAVNRQIIGSNPIDISKDKVAEWLRHWFATPTFMSSNLILVSNLEVLSNWLARQTEMIIQRNLFIEINFIELKSGLFGACRFEPYYFHNKHLWCNWQHSRFPIYSFEFESR